MKKSKKTEQYNLDPEERELLVSFEKGEWKSVRVAKKSAFEKIARNQIKEKIVRVRVAEETLQKLQNDAEELGIPYPLLIASVLNRYAHGRLQDARYLLQAIKSNKLR